MFQARELKSEMLIGQVRTPAALGLEPVEPKSSTQPDAWWLTPTIVLNVLCGLLIEA